MGRLLHWDDLSGFLESLFEDGNSRCRYDQREIRIPIHSGKSEFNWEKYIQKNYLNFDIFKSNF